MEPCFYGIFGFTFDQCHVSTDQDKTATTAQQHSVVLSKENAFSCVMLSRVSYALGRSATLRRAMPVAGTARRGYHENIVEHYENPRNVGSLDKDDASVGTVSPRGRLL